MLDGDLECQIGGQRSVEGRARVGMAFCRKPLWRCCSRSHILVICGRLRIGKPPVAVGEVDSDWLISKQITKCVIRYPKACVAACDLSKLRRCFPRQMGVNVLNLLESEKRIDCEPRG